MCVIITFLLGSILHTLLPNTYGPPKSPYMQETEYMPGHLVRVQVTPSRQCSRNQGKYPDISLTNAAQLVCEVSPCPHFLHLTIWNMMAHYLYFSHGYLFFPDQIQMRLVCFYLSKHILTCYLFFLFLYSNHLLLNSNIH